MRQFDFSGKTCPEGFTYVPAKLSALSEHLNNGCIFDSARAQKAVKAVESLIAEHNAQQACFCNFALFTLSIFANTQTMAATLTTVAANEDPQADDGRFEQVLGKLIGRVKTSLNEFYGYGVAFDIRNGCFFSDMDDGNGDALF